jgi:hypothetical protein
LKNHSSILVVLRIILIVVILGFGGLSGNSAKAAQITVKPVRWNSPEVVPSPRESSSWFPNLAVDKGGNVHIVWCETFSNSQGDLESIYHSSWNGSQWSQYMDIVSPAADIRRNSITIDQNNRLHMTYNDSRESNPYRLVYTSADVEKAFSAANWSPIVYLNDRGQTYFNEIVSYKNTLHVLYEDTGNENNVCPGCSDVFYRRSVNGGADWESPVRILATAAGSSRLHMSVDSNGSVYVSWDEGWDRLTGKGVPEYSVFAFSRDMGESWSAPLEIRHPAGNNTLLTVEGDGNGGIMLVWRTTSAGFPGIYFMWSNNYGETWSQPTTLPSFYARTMINYFDSFDMATDSAGHIHLLVVGNQVTSGMRRGETPGLFHFEWDGVRWYPPTQVYNAGLLPEYPRLVIDRGNELHATWFVRHDSYANDIPHQVLYAKGISAAPRVEPAVVEPRDEPVQAPVTQAEVSIPGQQRATPEVKNTPVYVSDPYVSSRSLYTENDEYVLLLFSLAPVVVVLGVIVIIVRKRQRF